MTLSEIGQYAIAHLAQKDRFEVARLERTRLLKIFDRRHGYQYECGAAGPDQDQEINYAHAIYLEERTKTQGTRTRLRLAANLYASEQPKP